MTMEEPVVKKEVYKSKVYTERPAYADFDAPEKFQARKAAPFPGRRVRTDSPGLPGGA